MKKLTKIAKQYATALIAALPEDWTITEQADGIHYGDRVYNEKDDRGYVIVMENGDNTEQIIFNVQPQKVKRGTKGAKVMVSGHTSYRETAANGWRCFTRRGIDCDSFSHHDVDKYSDPVAPDAVGTIIATQRKRITEAKDRAANMVQIPGMRWRILKAHVDVVSTKLQSGGSHQFTPHGFGTGEVISMKRRHRGQFGGRKASTATAKFFGVSTLYVETFDHD